MLHRCVYKFGVGSIKAALDFYTSRNGLFTNFYSSNHVADVQAISSNIIIANPPPTAKQIVDQLEKLNHLKTGDVAAIIHFLREKLQYFTNDNKSEKKLSS